MSAKHQLRTYLLLRAPLAALVGGRIYPGASPQWEAFPIVEIESQGREQPHYMTAATGSVEASFEINIYDRDEGRGSIIADAVRSAMNGAPGDMGELEVSHAVLEGEDGEEIPPSDGSDDPIYNIGQTWSIWYTESVPTFPAN